MHDGTFIGVQGVHRGQVTGIGPEGRAMVTLPSVTGTLQLAAESLVPVGPEVVGQAVAVTMMDDQPLILGLLQPAQPVIEVDGERLVFEAQREVTLKCGKASIRLTADGRVTIRGTQVLSRADGPNRVQGASVQLN